MVAETFLRKDLLASARRRPFWKTVFGKLFLGNCLWKIVFGKPLFWKTVFGKIVNGKLLFENCFYSPSRPSYPTNKQQEKHSDLLFLMPNFSPLVFDRPNFLFDFKIWPIGFCSIRRNVSQAKLITGKYRIQKKQAKKNYTHNDSQNSLLISSTQWKECDQEPITKYMMTSSTCKRRFGIPER